MTKRPTDLIKPANPVPAPAVDAGEQETLQADCQEMLRLMERKHAATKGDHYFEASVTADDDQVVTKVILRNLSGSYYYPVEGRLAHQEQELSQRDAFLLLFDYIDLYFEEYLKTREVYLPIDWADYECEGAQLQLRGQILNLEAERLADEYLAGSPPQSPPPAGT